MAAEDRAVSEVERECRARFNQPVLDGFELARLVGYGETAVDRYYILRGRRGVYWLSAVGGPTWLDRLKGQGAAAGGEVWDDWTRIENLLALNGVPRADAFVLDLRPDDDERAPGESLCV